MPGEPLRSGAPAWVPAAATVAHRRRRCRHLCHRRCRMAGGSRCRHEWRPPASSVWPAMAPSGVGLCVAICAAVGVHRGGGVLAFSPGGDGGGGGVDGGSAWWEQECHRWCRHGPARPLPRLEQDREQSSARDVAFHHLHERGSIRQTPSRQQADLSGVNSKADKQCVRAMLKGEALHD